VKESIDSVRERIRSLLRLSPPSTRLPVTIVTEAVDDGFSRSLIKYVAPDRDQIEAFLFQPIGKKSRGAVLALHQHNSQWTMGKSEIAGLVGDPLQAFGPALALQGLTVLAPDSIGFESRLMAAGSGINLAPPLLRPHSTPEGWLQYYNQMAYRLVQGDLLIRKVLDDCASALSVLLNYSDDPGVIGHSFGGIAALFLSALDTRVAYACSSGAACSFRHKFDHGTGLEMSLIIPSFTQHFEITDLIRCIAPRSMLIVSAEDDPQSADAVDLVREALPVFEEHHCAGHLQHLRVPGPHALDRRRFEAIVGWMVDRVGERKPPN
jgi:dienelactone hydrolase